MAFHSLSTPSAPDASKPDLYFPCGRVPFSATFLTVHRALTSQAPPLHGLRTGIPRRAAQPRDPLRGRRPAGEAGEARARALRPLSLPQREVALLHGQRREGLLPLLRLRRARQRPRIRDEFKRPKLPRGGRAPGRPGRPAGPRGPPGRKSAAAVRGG